MNALKPAPETTADVIVIEPALSDMSQYHLDLLSRGQPWVEEIVIRETLTQLDLHICSALEVGRLLLWSKATLQHGEFTPWLAANIGIKPRSARNYMQVARWVLDHPSMAAPAARMGLKRVLELTQLPEQTIEDITSGRLPELDVPALEALPYPELKKRLARVDKERDELADKLKKKDEELREYERVEQEDALARGRLTSKSQKKIVDELDKLRTEFDKLMINIGNRLDDAAAGCASNQYDIAVRLRIRAFSAYMRAYTKMEDTRFLALANEDVTGSEMAEPFATRPMGDVYQLPAGRILPFADET